MEPVTYRRVPPLSRHGQAVVVAMTGEAKRQREAKRQGGSEETGDEEAGGLRVVFGAGWRGGGGAPVDGLAGRRQEGVGLF